MKIKKNKKSQFRMMFHTLIVLILFLSIPASIFAAGNNQSKEEVIYGILEEDGSAREVYIVNVFNGKGEIIDYGDYRDIRNMTSDAEIIRDGSKIIIDNPEEKIYYEGILKRNELPWDISVQYFLDNKEYSAKEIAGKSGDLEIKMKIDENPNCDSFFFENYGIQTTVVLDTEKVQEIKAENATIANIGKNKQLTYTILPGKSADISIEAAVEDFEMEAISINGIKLNLSIDIDDEALIEKIEELLSGVNQLDQRVNDLKNGALKLNKGSSKLATGAEALQSGTKNLDGGVHSLTNGIKEMNRALKLLDSQSSKLTKGSGEFKTVLTEVQSSLSEISTEVDKIQELSEASAKIKIAIKELNTNLGLLNENVGYDHYKASMKANGLDLDELKVGNQNASIQLNLMIQELEEISIQLKEIPELGSLAEEINQQIENLSGIEALFEGNHAVINGSEIYLEKLSQSISEIHLGSSDLNESYRQFDQAISELLSSLNKMISKLPKLTDALNILLDKYSEFDKGLIDYTDALAQIVVGHQEIVDGASSLNIGSSSLKLGSTILYDNMSDLATGSSDLYKGSEDLAEGTKAFNDRTANLDQEVQNEIDETLRRLTADQSEVISFASSKNKNVESVQFVMRTNEIQLDKKAEEFVLEEQAEKSFWDKLKNLFTFKN